MRTKILAFTFFYFILITLFSLHVPFFWDGTSFTNISVFFYNTGFKGFIAPPQTDTGGFPLYSSYLAISWTLFGKSLFVSHLAMVPFLFGIVNEYFKLAKNYLNDTMLLFAMIFLMIEPVLLTQSILMGYDLLMVWLFLLCLNLLLKRRDNLFSIALIFLSMSSVRGIILGVSLFILEALLNKKINLSFFYKYIPALLAILLWAIYHHSQTGWFLFSPERENNAESLLPLAAALKQIGFILWKINDLGRIFLWLFLVVAGFVFYRKSKTIPEAVKILFVPLFVLTCIMAFLANPIGPKYFIVTFLCLQIAVCFLLQQISSAFKRIVLFGILCIALLTGNFWLYPERYGNTWDSSLKVIPYFELKNKMDAYIMQQKIQPELIGTQFPLIADKQFSNLTDSSYHYTNVWLGPVEKYDYYLQSNVINTDIPDQITRIKNNWMLLKTESAGQVYLSLYKRIR